MMEKEYIQVSFENGNIERKSYPAGIRHQSHTAA